MPLEPCFDDMPKLCPQNYKSEFIRDCHQKRFFCKFQCQGKGKHDFTHWFMSQEHSGKMCVPNQNLDQFYAKYAQCIQKGETIFLTEKRSKISRVFVDLDFAAGYRRLLDENILESLITVAAKTIALFYSCSPFGFATGNDEKTKELLAQSHKNFPLAQEHLRCLILHTTRKYPIDQVIERCKGNGKQYEEEEPSGKIATLVNKTKYGCGIRLYFPDLYANDEQLNVMRRACLITWKHLFGDATDLGFADWSQIFDSSVYSQNGLRLTGSRKAEECKFCKSKKRKIQTVGIGNSSGTGASSTGSNNNSNSNSPVSMCSICCDDPMSLVNIGRVYSIWKVLDLHIRSTNTQVNSKTSWKTYLTPSQRLTRQFCPSIDEKLANDYLSEHFDLHYNVTEFNALKADIHTLITKTKIRTTGGESEKEISRVWNQSIFEHLIGYKIDFLMPLEATKRVVLQFSPGQTISMCDNETGNAMGKQIEDQTRKKIMGSDMRSKLLTHIISTETIPEYALLEVLYITYTTTQRAMYINVKGPGCKFCQNVNREHLSNNIYFYATAKTIVQRCYCKCDTIAGRLFGKCSTFKSKVYPLQPKYRQILFPETDFYDNINSFSQVPTSNSSVPDFVKFSQTNQVSANITENENDENENDNPSEMNKSNFREWRRKNEKDQENKSKHDMAKFVLDDDYQTSDDYAYNPKTKNIELVHDDSDEEDVSKNNIKKETMYPDEEDEINGNSNANVSTSASKKKQKIEKRQYKIPSVFEDDYLNQVLEQQALYRVAEDQKLWSSGTLKPNEVTGEQKLKTNRRKKKTIYTYNDLEPISDRSNTDDDENEKQASQKEELLKQMATDMKKGGIASGARQKKRQKTS